MKVFVLETVPWRCQESGGAQSSSCKKESFEVGVHYVTLSYLDQNRNEKQMSCDSERELKISQKDKISQKELICGYHEQVRPLVLVKGLASQAVGLGFSSLSGYKAIVLVALNTVVPENLGTFVLSQHYQLYLLIQTMQHHVNFY